MIYITHSKTSHVMCFQLQLKQRHCELREVQRVMIACNTQ